MKDPDAKITNRLEIEENIWLATVRPDSRPHLVPVWFIWEDKYFFICISGQSVKFLNISQNNSVVLSLENGSTPVICEGLAKYFERPWPKKIVREFKKKYDWEIETDNEYDALVKIIPKKWLSWD